MLEALGKVVEGVFGLRYLFSAKYREKVHARWRVESKFAIFMEIFETVIAVIFLFIVLYIIYTLGIKSGQIYYGRITATHSDEFNRYGWVIRLFKFYFKSLWWFIIIFSIFSIFAFPALLIYDNYYPWDVAENELKEHFPDQSHIGISGYAYDYEYKDGETIITVQRSYVLYPRVFKDWSIVTIFEINEKDIKVRFSPYTFIFYLVFWGGILGMGFLYSIPKIYKTLKSKMRKQPSNALIA